MPTSGDEEKYCEKARPPRSPEPHAPSLGQSPKYVKVNNALPNNPTQNYLHVRQMWLRLYRCVQKSQTHFSREEGTYNELPFPTREIVNFAFFHHPPRCKTHCCTGKWLSVGRRFWTFIALVLKCYTSHPEWVYDCTAYPEPPKVWNEFWDIEVQGDIRFSKPYENILSRNYGWKAASVRHMPYITDCGPRRSLICISICIYCILHIVFGIFIIKW